MKAGTWTGITALSVAAACAAPGGSAVGREVRGVLLDGGLGPGLRAGDLRLVADRVEWDRNLEGCVTVVARLGVGSVPPTHAGDGSLPLGLYVPTYRSDRNGEWESRVATADGTRMVRTSAWLGGFVGEIVFSLYDVPRDATAIEVLPVELSVRRVLRSADESVVIKGPGDEADLRGIGIGATEGEGLGVWIGRESERPSLFFPDFCSDDALVIRDARGRRLDGGISWSVAGGVQTEYGEGTYPVTITLLRPTRWEAGLVRFELRDLPIPPPPAARR